MDFSVGGYGSETYPKAALVELARTRTAPEVRHRDRRGGHRAHRGLAQRRARRADQQCQTIAVATGNATEAELRSAGADIVLPTLADTDRVVRAVESLTGGG